MNKDKELEEAIKVLRDTIKHKPCSKNLCCDNDCYECILVAIETVLQALENSIPKKKIEDKIKELENCKMDIVQSPVHNVNEKMKMLDRNMIKREVLQDLLEDK